MQNAEIITFLLSVSPLRAISRSVWSVSMTMFSNIRGYNILKTDIHNKVLRCWEGIDGKMNGHAHYPRWPCFYHITHGKTAKCTLHYHLITHCKTHFPQLPYYMMYNAGKCIFHCYLVTLSKEPDLILNETDMEHPMSSIQVISWRMKIENPKEGAHRCF